MENEEELVCPLCMEPLDLTDRATNLCTACDYSICIWCFHHIMEDAAKENIPGRCPNCRTLYDAASITMERINPRECAPPALGQHVQSSLECRRVTVCSPSASVTIQGCSLPQCKIGAEVMACIALGVAD